MTEEIKYNGLTTVPSDYECNDGDLSGAVNAVIEDGAVKPVYPPKTIFAPNKEGEYHVSYIHKVGEQTNYILYSHDFLHVSWCSSDNSEITDIKTIDNVKSINSIGNTLVVIADDGMHYILWKADTKTYKYLGTQIPDFPISFGLQGDVKIYSDEDRYGFTISKSDFDADENGKFTDDSKRKITQQVLAKVNKHIAEETINNGKFCFPFFLRYALRLYDGTLVNHSAPIFMMPSTNVCPLVMIPSLSSDNKLIEILLVAAGIDYQVIESADAVSIKNNWKDIVKDIVVYVSKPIYTYDQNGEIESYSTKFPTTHFLGAYKDGSTLSKYYEWNYINLLEFKSPYYREITSNYWTLDLPMREEDEIADDIKNTNNFYLLKAIPLDDIELSAQSKRTEIEIPKTYLQSLTSREVMTDDYLTHDKKMPSYTFAFNNRLSIANVKRKPYQGYNPCSMFTYIEGSGNAVSLYNLTIDTFIKDDSGNIMVTTDYASSYIPINRFLSLVDNNGKSVPKNWGNYLFYPNANAFKMIVKNQGTAVAVIDLKPHDFLNGAYAYLGFDQVYNTGTFNDVVMTGATISEPNKVFTSEINNPFYFPATSINTIGTGEIYGISSAVKALSQGQFGQFPMYVFASDGVWALETSATGTFVAKQPVTRDVCNCPESITQLDGAVLFSTQRGIMMLQGATTTCISIDLDADSQDTLVIDELLTKFGYPIPHHISFKEYIKDCRMVYDYIKQRIIVLNPSYDYAYVYSLKSQKWTTMESNMYSNINSYPDALVVMRDGSLADLNNVTDDTIKATLVTRAIKLGGGDILKTMKGVYQRGLIPVDGVSTILYGSRDYINWHPVSSSAITKMTRIGGTPYKAFRLATLIDFKKGNSLFGVTTEFDTRFNNKIR